MEQRDIFTMWGLYTLLPHARIFCCSISNRLEEAAARPRKAAERAALHSCAKAPGPGSIWILNIRWGRQCLKYTGWMGLASGPQGIQSITSQRCPLAFCLTLPVCVTLTYSPPPSASHSLCLHLSLSASITLCFQVDFHPPFPALCPRLYLHFLSSSICSSLIFPCCVHWAFVQFCFTKVWLSRIQSD